MSRMKDRHRKLARERFWSDHDKESYRCPGCHRQNTDFEIHHIDGNAHNNKIENLKALCRFCHCLEEGRKPPLDDIEHIREQLRIQLKQTPIDWSSTTHPEVNAFIKSELNQRDYYDESLYMIYENFMDYYDDIDADLCDLIDGLERELDAEVYMIDSGDVLVHGVAYEPHK